jgi:hypothetical protein
MAEQEAEMKDLILLAVLAVAGALTAGGLCLLDRLRSRCGCLHARAFHQPETGKCKARVYQKNTSSSQAQFVECHCQQYTGREKGR